MDDLFAQFAYKPDEKKAEQPAATTHAKPTAAKRSADATREQPAKLAKHSTASAGDSEDARLADSDALPRVLDETGNIAQATSCFKNKARGGDIKGSKRKS